MKHLLVCAALFSTCSAFAAEPTISEFNQAQSKPIVVSQQDQSSVVMKVHQNADRSITVSINNNASSMPYLTASTIKPIW